MPYLNASKREYFSSLVSEIIDTRIEVAGDLNYLFTMLIKEYIKQNGECYKHYNDCISFKRKIKNNPNKDMIMESRFNESKNQALHVKDQLADYIKKVC